MSTRTFLKHLNRDVANSLFLYGSIAFWIVAPILLITGVANRDHWDQSIPAFSAAALGLWVVVFLLTKVVLFKNTAHASFVASPSWAHVYSNDTDQRQTTKLVGMNFGLFSRNQSINIGLRYKPSRREIVAKYGEKNIAETDRKFFREDETGAFQVFVFAEYTKGKYVWGPGDGDFPILGLVEPGKEAHAFVTVNTEKKLINCQAGVSGWGIHTFPLFDPQIMKGIKPKHLFGWKAFIQRTTYRNDTSETKRMKIARWFTWESSFRK